jgi:hypothetical protein
MSWDIALCGMLNHMELSEIMAPHSRLNVYHKSFIVIDDRPDICM